MDTTRISQPPRWMLAPDCARRFGVLCGGHYFIFSYRNPAECGLLMPLAWQSIARDASLGELARLSYRYGCSALWLLPVGAAPGAERDDPYIIAHWGQGMTPEALTALYPEYQWGPLTTKGVGAGAQLCGWRIRQLNWRGQPEGHPLTVYTVWAGWGPLGNLELLPVNTPLRARVLASTITLAAHALGIQLQFSPGYTGVNMLREELQHFQRGQSAVDFTPLSAEWQERIHAHLPAAVMWGRALLPDEGERTAHGLVLVRKYDRNMSYVTAARRVPVGEPRPTRDFVPDTPGFYRLHAYAPGNWPQRAPGIFHLGEGAGNYPHVVQDVWAWEPQIRLALKTGWHVKVEEGYYWPRTSQHELFRTWQERIWNARRLVLAQTEALPLVAARAEALIKLIGVSTIGRLKQTPGYKVVSLAEAHEQGLQVVNYQIDSRGQHTGMVTVRGQLGRTDLIQPSWWATIIANAAERLQAATLNYAPRSTVLMWIDALYTLQDVPALAGDKLKVGGFRHDYTAAVKDGSLCGNPAEMVRSLKAAAGDESEA